MGIKLYREPELEKPIMFVSWPGIGNIGIIAANTLKGILKAEEFGEIESWDFFYPRKVSIRDGLLEDLEFPSNKFYYERLEKKDLIFFVGEEQPTEGGGMYARGEKAYQMANLVLEVSLKFDCQRVYTSGACISPIHHQMKPRVCAVVSSENLIREVKKYPNTILMSEIGGRGEGEGTITGLNGLLLALAKKRGLETICLMGEIPDWLSGASFPYPKASKSVLEVFAEILGIRIDFSFLNKMEAQVEEIIESFYAKFPPEMKEEYDQRKFVAQTKPGTITIQAQIYIDERFKKGGDEGGERPV
ncbi:MAG: PAC2 family protein [Deltaproteobacteria bacterium]|jgi:proteasome assembly chaperone (PAC2) family protein|nr:PAC2 family protein [Deltaproteobacteria bacterium]